VRPKRFARPAVVISVFLVCLVIWWDYLIFFPLRNGLDKTGMTFAAYLNLESGEFQNGFAALNSSIWNPAYSMRASGWTTWVILVAFLIACGSVFWMAARNRWTERKQWICLVALPLATGAFMQPVWLKHLFAVSAEHGLGGQWYVGAVFGESFSTVYLGLLGTVMAIVLLLLVRRTETASTSANLNA